MYLFIARHLNASGRMIQSGCHLAKTLLGPSPVGRIWQLRIGLGDKKCSSSGNSDGHISGTAPMQPVGPVHVEYVAGVCRWSVL